MEATVMATRYKRAMAPLDAKARARLWEGGRPPTAAAMAVSCRDSTGKLEQLVHAFYEAYHTGDRVEEEEEEERLPAKWRQALEAELKDAAVEPAVEWIRNKAEVAVGAAGLECDEVVRRRLVRWMQDGGLDAGICKSRWYNPSGIPFFGLRQLDNGGEYHDQKFKNFCATKGVKHDFIVPKTPQQNGVAQRMNRTITERARSRKLHASLPKKFWTEAVNTAFYLINRSPSVPLEKGLPDEA
ncbi:uncharacterized protein LOC110029931 [Phalaenopsis equestris]|uniref:uncharacterized protein LOC110029931 n=1 Tax=Phalaenopsis equestris TaxID=78828 RepID=UPI0009E1E05B|nr:uncharacterized protein LOC110029931 [Phalaenopsis equestris]